MRGEAAVLARLVRGMPRGASHAAALAAFYGPQAGQYDRLRERLLQGRAELMAALPLPRAAHVVELGGGTGRNAEFLGERLAGLASYTVVDLCRPLLERARERAQRIACLRVVEADATVWQPDAPVDAVVFSYSLTMIPDWPAAIANAVAMLRPGGTLAAVDFHVSSAQAPPDHVQHGALTRWFWPRWFAHDGVRLDARQLETLCRLVPRHALVQDRAPVPWLPLARVPYYRFAGTVQAP